MIAELRRYFSPPARLHANAFSTISRAYALKKVWHDLFIVNNAPVCTRAHSVKVKP